MNKIIRMGSLTDNPSQTYTLYSVEGLSPALSSCQRRYGGSSVFVLLYEENK